MGMCVRACVCVRGIFFTFERCTRIVPRGSFNFIPAGGTAVKAISTRSHTGVIAGQTPST